MCLVGIHHENKHSLHLQHINSLFYHFSKITHFFIQNNIFGVRESNTRPEKIGGCLTTATVLSHTPSRKLGGRLTTATTMNHLQVSKEICHWLDQVNHLLNHKLYLLYARGHVFDSLTPSFLYFNCNIQAKDRSHHFLILIIFLNYLIYILSIFGTPNKIVQDPPLDPTNL